MTNCWRERGILTPVVDGSPSVEEEISEWNCSMLTERLVQSADVPLTNQPMQNGQPEMHSDFDRESSRYEIPRYLLESDPSQQQVRSGLLSQELAELPGWLEPDAYQDPFAASWREEEAPRCWFSELFSRMPSSDDSDQAHTFAEYQSLHYRSNHHTNTFSGTAQRRVRALWDDPESQE